jgi:hypothetical protein
MQSLTDNDITLWLSCISSWLYRGLEWCNIFSGCEFYLFACRDVYRSRCGTVLEVKTALRVSGAKAGQGTKIASVIVNHTCCKASIH